MLDTKLVHVLVHRESEEYNTSDVEDNPTVCNRGESRKPPEIKISPGSDDLSLSGGSAGDLPESIVKIMVESPKDPPQIDYNYTVPEGDREVDPQPPVPEVGQVSQGEIRIDVNMPVDSTNIFYEYEGGSRTDEEQS